jgi:hypothetical protein
MDGSLRLSMGRILNSTTAALIPRPLPHKRSGQLAGACRGHRPHAAQARCHPTKVETFCKPRRLVPLCLRHGQPGLGFDGGGAFRVPASRLASSSDFLFGASLVSTLRQEAAALARLGARELDMVIPIGHLKSGNHQAVHHTVHAAAPLRTITAHCSK